MWKNLLIAARVSSAGQVNSQLKGTILVNGVKRVESKFRKISAYVLQDDYMYAHLTVFETLMLSAHFFLPETCTDDEKKTLVESIITELGLIKAKNTIIGNDKVRGVSGGERKRASVAVQLLSDPAVLFLDEPTSGLDAFQSQSIMESMRTMANNGRCVISVIHQPRSSIFEMFDRLLILSEGYTMYFGDAKNAVSHFSSVGCNCPSNFNPPDFFLDLLSPDNRNANSEAESRNRIKFLAGEWKRIEDAQQQQLQIQRTASGDSLSEINSTKIKSIGTTTSFTKTRRNFVLLCWRSFASQSRNVPVIVIKIVFSIFFALIIGGIYNHIGYSQTSIQNRTGALFFIVINQAFNNVIAVLNTFPSEKIIVNRERSGRAYNTLSYFFAKVIVELPLNLLPTIIFGLIVYYLVEFQGGMRFLYFMLIIMMQNFVACSLGLAISALSPTVEFANAAGPPLVIIGILFGGFYISVDSLPIVANWIPYLSMFKWGFEALMINEFTGLEFECDPSGNCQKYGEEVLEFVGFGHHTTNYAVFGLGMLLVAYLFCAFLILHFNVMTYCPLGHTGAKFQRYSSLETAVATSVVADSSVKGDYMTVLGNDKDENNRVNAV